jgi:hypothetical protein
MSQEEAQTQQSGIDMTIHQFLVSLAQWSNATLITSIPLGPQYTYWKVNSKFNTLSINGRTTPKWAFSFVIHPTMRPMCLWYLIRKWAMSYRNFTVYMTTSFIRVCTMSSSNHCGNRKLSCNTFNLIESLVSLRQIQRQQPPQEVNSLLVQLHLLYRT